MLYCGRLREGGLTDTAVAVNEDVPPRLNERPAYVFQDFVPTAQKLGTPNGSGRCQKLGQQRNELVPRHAFDSHIPNLPWNFREVDGYSGYYCPVIALKSRLRIAFSVVVAIDLALLDSEVRPAPQRTGRTRLALSRAPGSGAIAAGQEGRSPAAFSHCFHGLAPSCFSVLSPTWGAPTASTAP